MDFDIYADVIDSRDVIEALEDDELDENTRAILEAFAEDASEVEDWEFGATFVRGSYFKDYAMELADEIGAIPTEYTWPISCIDWNQAAWELKMDYSSYDLDGVTYWARA